MVTAPLAIALFGIIASIAIVMAFVATMQTRTARAALRASEARHHDSVERDRKIEAGNRLAGDVAHDLNDLLTAITGHTELLIASLDPGRRRHSGCSRDSPRRLECRTAHQAAARLERRPPRGP